MSKDVCAPSKSTQHNTPINKSEFTETITVTDPRHPLYGQTFRLIQVEDRSDRGKCCLVERDWGQNSYLPLNVTDKSEIRWVSSSIPLSVKAIRQLVVLYTRLTEDNENGSTHPTPETSNRDSSQERLVTLDRSPEETGSPDTDSSLPDVDAEDGKGKPKR